jgi:hypothetical protein
VFRFTQAVTVMALSLEATPDGTGSNYIDDSVFRIYPYRALYIAEVFFQVL